ncbi:TPA: hypothetical protein ACT2F4_001106 [Streptococcus suis]
MLVDNVLFCYFNIECSRTLNQIEQTICIILSILVFLGETGCEGRRHHEKRYVI